ncbi:MAG: O-antigen ligase family protein [Anaerolineae bacterium]
MTRQRRARIQTMIGLAAAVLCLLAMGALRARWRTLTRGIPEGLPQPIPYGGPQIGLNVSLTQVDEEALQQNLDAIQATGIVTLKQSFYFTEPFDWAESDRLFTAMETHGLTLIPLLDGNPDDSFAPPADPTRFATWAAEFARRYGHWVQYYIIWDEPNLTTHWGNQNVNPAEYAALLTASAQAVRAVDADAVIVAAPLAPTIETGPANLSDVRFLQGIYDTGAAAAFDIVAGKPYGFYTGPDDRNANENTLNFSRAILLRETVEKNGDNHKAVWAGNWGWNSLPQGWQGPDSIWGQVTAQEQADWTVKAFERARQEWPWMGLMFLENWQPDAPADDPRWGFSIAGRSAAARIQTVTADANTHIAYPGFYLADAADPAQQYEGRWRFDPDFGADIGETGDRVRFSFWGTEAGLRVRRADYRARLYITVDGRPANALPQDEQGSMLILTAPSRAENYTATELVARNLAPGKHTLEVVASRGWEQWALNGFSIAYHPDNRGYRQSLVSLAAAAALFLLLAVQSCRAADWGTFGQAVSQAYLALQHRTQLALTALAAAIVLLTGWLTWGAQAAGIYRRLGDGGQLMLTAAAASLFYVTPSFLIYAAALLILFFLITLRPAWGVVLIAFCIPFYVPPLPKPILNYRFSPVEVFTLVTLAAFFLSRLLAFASLYREAPPSGRLAAFRRPRFHKADLAVLAFTAVATASLFFTERLEVATNEWRVVILEPAIFYFLLRATRLKRREMWLVLDAFVAGGVVVAVYGLWQYVTGQNLITAEAGLMRLRSIYGSPNNVALYLGRTLPLLTATAVLGAGISQRRRWAYAAAVFPISAAILLSFSKGALFLGVPAALLFVFWQWQQAHGRRTWPWIIGGAVVGGAALALALRVPQLTGRLDVRGTTGVFRVHLWRASVNMFRDHPWFGVGLDNFLYAYRGRYILQAAWQEPNLNHPHNILLDFATRLGALGLITGGWMFAQLAALLRRLRASAAAEWTPLVVGLGGALVDVVMHGLVDHSFFLVDLSFAFYLMLGTAVWLANQAPSTYSQERRN